nr:primosomal protein N' [Lachnospiraceae bacterium]
KKFGHDAIISAFNDGKADILIGTQMIVKGHDFPNVTLVGILAADLSLNSGDYTSQERTYDLIVQAAGRAGRAEKKGDVIIQTYKPEEYAINTAAVGDYKKFYEFESNYRRLLHYPPFSHILEMFVFSKDEKYLRDACDKLAKDVNKRLSGKGTCLGPVEAPIFKVSDTFRMYIYVKSTDIDFLRKLSLDYEKIYSKVKGLDVQFKLS